MATMNSSGGSGENINLYDILIKGKRYTLNERLAYFSNIYKESNDTHHNFYSRQVISSADRQVEVMDPHTHKPIKMLMFGSNNYLGLANHPHVCEMVHKAIDKYGTGIGGPPLLNGYTNLIRELEERLSFFKHAEDTLLFSSGYSTNLGLITGLINFNDVIYFDEYSHASFCDGVKLSKVKKCVFRHNNMDELSSLLLERKRVTQGDTFVGVEGVYSMDGDLAPLDTIVPLCKKSNAILMVDDAHGTGVLGANGSGTSEYFGKSKEIDINMGTFSKVFAMTGGFISASKPVINYLRFFARSYMFSASLPPVVVAAVLAGLDVIEKEPERRRMLFHNVKYAAVNLRKFGFVTEPKAGIITLRVPEKMNIREAANYFHHAGIFLNAIEYPAVPVNEQRFRISMMATHTEDDINKLIACVEEIWSKFISHPT
jgi:glycine C-acetyltransferase